MNDTGIPLSGSQLLTDFQSVYVNLATVENARYEASRSEDSVMQYLRDSSFGGYLNPGTFAPNTQDNLTRASMDAHIKKVQVAQLESMSAQQLQQLMLEDQAAYKGRKVKVTALRRAHNPIEVVWFNAQSGFRSNTYNRQSITGYIEDVLLDRNILYLKPGRAMRFVNHELQGYAVYVTDPATFDPLISLELL